MRAALSPGLHESVPFSEYLALAAWGSSSLRAMRRGPPARVLWERSHPMDDTDATRLGHAVHCRVLTPERFDATYAHKPDGMTFASKEGKVWRAANSNRLILTHDEWERVHAIADALHAKEVVATSLANASAAEATILWTCPQSREQCKARPDWIVEREHYLVDLKVSRVAANRPAIPFRAYAEGWLHQLAHYRTGAIVSGMDIRRGRLVIVDSKPPHFIWALEAKMEALDLLELDNIETLRQLRECRVANNFPGTPEEWVKIDPPPTALVQLGDVELSDEEGTEDPDG